MTFFRRRQVLVVQRAVASRFAVVLATGGFVVAAAAFAVVDESALVANDPATPNVVVPTGSPAPCGAPVSRWGSATASDVRVQIERAEHDVPVAGTPTPAASGQLFTVELAIANLGNETVRIERGDVTVRTCRGQDLQPESNTLDAETLLGTFAPGDERAGTLAFAVDDDDQARMIVVEIQETNRTGARIECDLVVASDNIESQGEIAVGCDAFGGTGQAGADAVGEAATAPTETGD